MHLALEEARKGLGYTSPNPPVGAVIVKEDTVSGSGWHKKAGEAHAEVNALRDAAKKGNSAEGATLYVTLEPCCHFGKTPPCTEAIIQAGIARVVVGSIDKNKLVAGKGVQALRNAGITVECEILKKECDELLRFFNCFITKERPYFIHKGACSLDGKTATSAGESQWITSKESREAGHRLRNSVDAILTGAGTLLADNPRLTTRLPGQQCHNPLRLILNPSLKLPEKGCQLLSVSPQSETLFFYDKKRTDLKNKQQIEGAGCRTHALQTGEDGVFDLGELCSLLHKKGVCSVLLEGGAETIAHFYKAKLVDEVHLFLAPMLLGGNNAPGLLGGEGFPALSEAPELTSLTWEKCGCDLSLRGKVVYTGKK